MPFNYESSKSFYDKALDCYNKALSWAAEVDARWQNWRSMQISIEFVVYLALLFFLFNPIEWPFPTLHSTIPRFKQFGWYAPVFWSLFGVIFVIGVIKAARARFKPFEPAEFKPGVIKGLAPFGYEDAEVFSHLQREEDLKECLQAIGDEQFRFGALSGESGVGKTSFLQAGLWPELERRGFRCVYVKFSDLDPFESVKRDCLKHLSFADGAPDGADFLGLLRAATAQDRTPIVLFFDQFEQFFVHRKRKKDREPFTQALAQWFAEMESSPVKILICVRGDFFDRLNELQKAMRYSLGPAQSFRLEGFGPDQATEIFCFLAEKEGMEYDREFISEMTRQEMVGAEEGLISPVDIQVLARMIERQIKQSPRAFNRMAFQKLGGAQVLLGVYLTIALEPLIIRSSRRAAINVLLALTDLDHDARAGALTFEDLRQKLGGDKADSGLKDAVACLLRSDLSLISPSPENEEEKFELAHERLILELAALAGKQAIEADYANQLLDHFTNLWLGYGRASRLLFSWSQLRLIKKHRRLDASGERRQEKEEYLAASRRRLRLRFAAVGLVVLLFLSVQIGSRSNAWQTFRIKILLYSQGFRLNDKEASIEIATALAYAGESRSALKVLDRIGNDYSKANALGKVAESYIQLGDKEKSSALLSDMIKIAERMDDGGKAYALRLIGESYIQLGDKGKAGSLLSEQVKVVERFSDDPYKAHVLSEIARSYVRLGEAMKAGAFLKEAIDILERTSDDQSKAHTLGAIADSYSEIAETLKDGAPLKEAIKAAGQIRDSRTKAASLSKIIQSYARLGEKMKDGSLLKEAIKAAVQIGDYRSLGAIVESYAGLGDKEKARVMREHAIRTVERISGNQSKAYALRVISLSYADRGKTLRNGALLKEALKIADQINDGHSKAAVLSAIRTSYAQLGETMKDGALLKEALKIAERTNDAQSKAYALRATADSYARLGETMKDGALLKEALKIAERTSDAQSKAAAFSAIARSYAQIGDKEKARALLENSIKMAERISDSQSKGFALNTIARSYFQLGETMKGGALLKEALNISERAGDGRFKADALSAIARSYIEFGKTMSDVAIMKEGLKTLERVGDGYSKVGELKAIAEFGETMKDGALLEEAVKIAHQISDDSQKAYALNGIADSYVRLGDKWKARVLLEDAIRTAEWIDREDKVSVLIEIVMSYAKLAESSNDPALLYDVARRLIRRLRADSDRDQLLDAILSSKFALTDVGRLRLLAASFDNEVDITRALARILMACSHPESIGKNRGAAPSAPYRSLRP
jgi:tetratricopeptide (TPR) repeat protein